jgi:hypothetical protein
MGSCFTSLNGRIISRSMSSSLSSGIASLMMEWCFWYEEITWPTRGHSEGRKEHADSTDLACHFSLSSFVHFPTEYIETVPSCFFPLI